MGSYLLLFLSDEEVVDAAGLFSVLLAAQHVPAVTISRATPRPLTIRTAAVVPLPAAAPKSPTKTFPSKTGIFQSVQFPWGEVLFRRLSLFHLCSLPTCKSRRA